MFFALRETSGYGFSRLRGLMFQSFFDLVIASDILYPSEKLRHKDLTEGTSAVIHLRNVSGTEHSHMQELSEDFSH